MVSHVYEYNLDHPDTYLWQSPDRTTSRLRRNLGWRRSPGAGDSASLKACEALLKEFLPKLKALPNAEVTRVVCGQCGDFKVIVNQPCADHDAWAGAEYNPLEAEFMAALKKIEG